jgi:multicomponent Na+:H+ antiporter subunit E
MNRALRIPGLLLWLTALWVALWGDLTLGNVVGGLVVAIGVLAVARPTGVTGLERSYFRPFAAVHYAVYFLVQLVQSNLVVAWEIVTPHVRINRAIIAVPMHTTSAAVVTLIANSITLTPGTVTIDVMQSHDPDGHVEACTLFIHVLHFNDVESVRRDVLKLERLAVKAFGSIVDLARVDAALAGLSHDGAVST